MEINKIIFFYPSKITGGAELLFMRCAKCLIENHCNYRVYYIDYADGFARRNLNQKDVHFIEYIKDEPVRIPDNSVVITQLNVITQFRELFSYDRQKSIILFWCLHSLNIKSQIFYRGHYFVSRSDRMKLGKEIRYLAEKNVVKFMGYVGYAKITEDLFQELAHFEWLPNIAPIDETLPKPMFKRISKDEIRFCWLGRLDVEKSKNVLTYMNELEPLSKICPISLSLIGDGPQKEYLVEQSKKYSFPIRFVGEKRDTELDVFIRNETEIGLASGTSAFEFSLRGKPVIIDWVLDRVYEAGERKKYIATHESDNIDYSSGRRLLKSGMTDFKTKLEEVMCNYDKIAEKCYDYVYQKRPSVTCEKLINTIDYISKQKQEEITPHLIMISKITNKGKRRIDIFKKIASLVRLLRI